MFDAEQTDASFDCSWSRFSGALLDYFDNDGLDKAIFLLLSWANSFEAQPVIAGAEKRNYEPSLSNTYLIDTQFLGNCP
jgi:hypothetical protein